MPTKFFTTVTVLPPRPAFCRMISTRPLDLRGGSGRSPSFDLPAGSPALLKSANGLLKPVIEHPASTIPVPKSSIHKSLASAIPEDAGQKSLCNFSRELSEVTGFRAGGQLPHCSLKGEKRLSPHP